MHLNPQKRAFEVILGSYLGTLLVF